VSDSSAPDDLEHTDLQSSVKPEPTGPADNGAETLEGTTYLRQIKADRAVNRLYGKVLPSPIRAWLVSRTTPQQRQKIRRNLSLLLTPLSGATQAAKTLAVSRRKRPHETLVPHGGRTLLAHPVATPTPLLARRRNLSLITEQLDALGVPYAVIRGTDSVRGRVALPARYRADVAQALIQAAHTDSIYLQRTQHGTALQLASDRTIHAAITDDYFRITRVLTDPSHSLVLALRYGCDVEFWAESDGKLQAPRPNPCTETVDKDEQLTDVAESVLTAFSPRHQLVPTYPTWPGFAEPIYSDIEFPIDLVYTWVDGSDPEWQARRAQFEGDTYHPEASDAARFISHDELRYSLRSVWMNLPWIRTIYLVTDRQVPIWLSSAGSNLVIIDHRDIFTDRSLLPTFNSHAIESQLHHIQDLSEHFIYLNDDVFVGMPLTPDQFFFANGMSKYFPSPALIPLGDPVPADIPSSIAGKNNRRLIRQAFGATITHKMKHTAHALQRSILAEIEERFSEDHRRTAASRLRDITDISVTSSLHHYYGFLTRRACPGAIRYAYFDLRSPDTPRRLRELINRRDRHIFCLNDTTADSTDGRLQRELLLPFLKAYFPVPSPYESLPA
jgi:hypothetical protein